MDQDNDVIPNLQELNNRLTKKAIRKPNVTEASEEYASLAKALDAQASYAYAGLVHIHRARAERLVPNAISEAGSLRAAGLAYSTAWSENVSQIGLPETGFESNATINSLVQSARVLNDFGDSLMASRRLCELGDLLFKGGQFTDAVAAYQRAISAVPTESIERSAYIDRLLQARTQLFLKSIPNASSYLAMAGNPDVVIPSLSEDQQLQNIELSITMFLLALLKVAVFLRSSFPLVPVSALFNFTSNRSSSVEVAPKSADNCDVTYAEDCDSLNRFLSNYPGCWRVGHGQLLRALAEAVWWRDSHAALAIEHALLPRLTGSRTQRDLCALIVTCLVSPVA